MGRGRFDETRRSNAWGVVRVLPPTKSVSESLVQADGWSVYTDGDVLWCTFVELETIMEADPEAKRSKRRRVTCIILKVIPAVVVVGLIIIAISSRSSAKALRKELEALRAAGIPTEVEEAFEQAIPEDQNAASTYTLAFAKIGEGISRSDLGIPRAPEGDVTGVLGDLKRIVRENADALALLRKAATFPWRYFGWIRTGAFKSPCRIRARGSNRKTCRIYLIPILPQNRLEQAWGSPLSTRL